MEPLYGQKELAEFCEFVIASLFQVAQPSPTTSTPAYGREGVDTPPYTPPAASQPAAKQPPVLVEFIAYALYRTRLPVSIVHQSLLLLSRLKQRYPSARGTSSSPHRLFLSSLMLSAKISMDDTYSNKSWTIVGSNFFALKEVNQMERELFAFLGWNVVVNKEELDDFVHDAEHNYSEARRLRLAESSKRRRLEEEAAIEARHQQARHAARALLRPHTPRHSSPIRSTASASSSRESSVAPSPMVASRQHSPEYTAHRSYTSSTASSTFPSATHSPTSPVSAPLSAGPQTPEHAYSTVHIHESPDFPEAASYLCKSRTKPRRSRPPSSERIAESLAVPVSA